MNNRRIFSANAIGFIYAYVHFSVEVSCFYFLYSRVAQNSDFWLWAMLFDALAFLPQSIIGMITDKYENINVGAIGGLSCIIALLIPINSLSLLFIGIGNSMIHISGANATLKNSNGNLTASGIFVGAGSFGVITGQLIAKVNVRFLALIPIILLVFSTLIMLLFHNPVVHFLPQRRYRFCKNYPFAVILISAVLIVAIRSYVGYAIPISWNKTVWQNILLFVFMGIGKSLGGWLSDRFGAREIGSSSILLSIPFMLFGNRIMVLSLIGIMLFSMTMTITLGMIVSIIPEMPGLSFGLTTFGLFLGFFPAFFVRPNSLLSECLIVAILLMSAFFMLILLLKKRSDCCD